MKKHKFVVGDRVGANMHVEGSNEWDDGELTDGLRWDEEGVQYATAFGKVVGFLDNGKVEVQWDNSYALVLNYMDGEMLDASQLLPEAEVKEQFSRLEKEFKDVEKQVKAQLKEAAKIIKDANKLAKKTGRKLADMYDAYSSLYDAMNASGWRTSSFGC